MAVSKFIFAFVIGIVLANFSNGAKTRKSYDNGNYVVDFEVVGPRITFDVVVQELGWVGLGVSNTGTMENSDLFMGGVRDGLPYWADYFATRNAVRPTEDTKVESDWVLQWYLESGNTTTLTFHRLLNTTDTSGEDIEIKNEPIYLLWSYSNFDVVMGQHISRGSELINLVNP